MFVFLASGAWGERLNVLFLSIDDLRPELGCCGVEGAVTPNLDRLAGEGRLFRRHYVAVATCGPSREAMLTGKGPRASREINHHYLAKALAGKPEGEEPETWIHRFRKAGYRTVGMGKISHSAGGYRSAGKGRLALELPHSWSEYVSVPKERWSGGLLHGYGSGIVREEEPAPVYEFLEKEDGFYPDGILAEMAVGKLEELAEGEEPFVLAVGFMKPHLPFTGPAKYWDLCELEDVSPNPDVPEGVSGVFLHASGEFNHQYQDQPEKGGLGVRFSDEYAGKVRRAYRAATAYVDVQVGKVLEKLEELDLAKNTVVVVWGDHGWHLGDQTIWGKHSAFERALKSALIVRVPGMAQAGVASESLVATVDLYPTLCELAGIEPGEGLDGTSLVPVLQNPKERVNEEVMSYWRNILSLRTERYRMAMFLKGERREVMLFDHELDSNEGKNLAGELPEVVAELTELMKKRNGGYLPELN
ncbi:MAG: sulfatase [Verrucomicrobiota bacterium]